jgi:hypothetical protein
MFNRIADFPTLDEVWRKVGHLEHDEKSRLAEDVCVLKAMRLPTANKS